MDALLDFMPIIILFVLCKRLHPVIMYIKYTIIIE